VLTIALEFDPGRGRLVQPRSQDREDLDPSLVRHAHAIAREVGGVGVVLLYADVVEEDT